MNHKLAQHKDCTGCMACQAACKHNAIYIRANRNGFTYPWIDNTKCVDCGACSRICPILNYEGLIFRAPRKSYAAKIQDSNITRGCTSGGIATALSLRTIKGGGVVYGAAFVPHEGVRHIRVVDEEQLELLKGSKYVESYIDASIYTAVCDDLKSGKDVLFIGTPCQVAAVENVSVVRKLRTISFVCGGGLRGHICEVI